MQLFRLPSARNCVAWIRRSGKIVRGIVQTDRDQVLLVGQPGELKYAKHEGDQQRYHRGTFDQRRSLLVEPERWPLVAQTYRFQTLLPIFLFSETSHSFYAVTFADNSVPFQHVRPPS